MVETVLPRFHRIESRLGSRRLAQWLIEGEDGALLFDTGVHGTVEKVIGPALTELGLGADRLSDVIVSHADVDHCGGDGEIRRLAPAARLRAHEADRAMIESWAVMARERYGWYRRHGLDYDDAAWSWLEQAAGSNTPLDGAVEDRQRIDLGRVELEVLHLPGHSPGHIGLFDPASRTAIVSDAVMGYGFDTVEGERAGPPPYVDLDAYRATIERLRELAPARLGTAHFPLLEGEAVRAHLDLSRRFTDDLEREVDQAGSRDVATILDPVAAALGGYPEMEVELARSIGAHLGL